MSTRSPEDDSRSHSPDDSLEKRPSKKRKVLSCYACRNRKMKCDRVYPVCGRCARTGRTDQCTYDPRLLEELNGNPLHSEDGALPLPSQNQALQSGFSAESLTWKLRTQHRRIEALEKKMTHLDGTKDFSHSPDTNGEGEEPPVQERLMFRGRGFKTLFYGSTSQLSLLNHYTELHQFTMIAMSLDSSMGRIRGDFKAFRNRRKAMLKEKGPLYQGTDVEILALIPNKRSLVEAEANLYFDNFENSHRVLHEPTFWRAFGVFWEKREESPASFAVCLVLVMACVRCLSADHEPVFIGDSSFERETASRWIDVCDAWLNRQGRKHLTLEYFQLLCLSLIAKRVNCVKMKQDWVYSGDMLRLAMSSGLHRNPELLPPGPTSEFEKEMRRRLWATMMELELQSSIDAGLQSSLCGLHFDSPPPANIDDEALSPQSAQEPVSRPPSQFTSSSYLVFSMKSLSLRVHLMKLLNDPTTDLHYSDILHYDSQINTLLSTLPKWDASRSQIPSAILDLQLRQFLLILHQPYAKRASTNSAYTFSFTACIDAGNAILSRYDRLTNSGIYMLNHLRHDLFRTGMSISQAVYHNALLPDKSESINGPSISASRTADMPTSGRAKKPPTSTPSPALQIPQLPVENFIFTTLSNSAAGLMEKAFSIFETKLMRLGTGYLEHWLLAAAIGIMPVTPNSQGPKDDVQTRCRVAIDRVTRICFKVLALQKDPDNQLASSLRSTMATASPPTIRSGSEGVGNIIPAVNSTPQAVDMIMSGGLDGLAAAAAVQGMSMPLQVEALAGFPPLQDMEASGWTFPDIWAFDMGGDF